MKTYRFRVDTPSKDGLTFDLLGYVEFTEEELKEWENTQAPYMGKKTSDYRCALALGQERFGHLRRKWTLSGIEYVSALVVEAV